MPTNQQLKTCFILCHSNTSLYLPIYLVTVDKRTKNVVILAGEETEIEIYPNGLWRYV
jgi:hypothetical protein